ncbi:MAG: hypothetical protein EXR86_01185 [Gammaproteobacteria bacterium]|nr:hypothetical protein [Gammaproteobacteria bacterium]
MSAFAASGLRVLEINNNHRLYFSPNNPQLVAYNELENTFVKNDTLTFVIAPGDGNVFTKKLLAIVEAITARAWQIPYSNRVDSITNFQYSSAVGDDLMVRDLVTNAADLSDAEIAKLKSIVLAEPYLKNGLIRDDAAVTAINVLVQLPREDESHEVPAVVKAAREIAADFEHRNPGLKIYLTGVVMMDHAFAEAAMKDSKTLVPISFGLMLMLVGFLVGGFIGALSTLLVIACAILAAMGIGGTIGYPVSAATSAAPVIILTVAMANCVHILQTYRQELGLGAEQLAAIETALRSNLKPIFLASLTTVIGFLSFNFSDVPPFRQLGNLVAFGDIFSYLLAVTLLPALLVVLPVGSRRLPSLNAYFVPKIADFAIRHYRALFYGIGCAALALIACLPRNELNDVFAKYFDETIEFRHATDFTVEHLTGVVHFYYTVDAGESEGISEPAFMQETAAFVEWLRARPEVRHVTSYTDILRRLNKNMHGDDSEYYRLPEARELAAQYLLLYEMSLPYGLDLNNQINVDKSAVKISVGVNTLSSLESLRFNAAAEGWLRDNAPHVKSATGFGTALMFAHLGRRNTESMLIGTAVALVLISAVLLVMLRSVKLGVLSLIPNLLPLAAGFGLWGLFVGQVGLSLSVVASMLLGIIVDDTVHFLVKYQRARNAGDLAPVAIRYAFNEVAYAMMVTTAVLVCGFLILSMSHFELNAGMGLLTAIVILLAMVIDLVFLAPCLLMFETRQHA